MTISVFELDFFCDLTDLTILAHQLIYSVSGHLLTTDCYVVKASAIKCDVHVGDILISINGVPLINNEQQKDEGFYEKYLGSMVNSQSQVKTIRFLRSYTKNAKNTGSVSYVDLTPKEAALIYHEYWMKAEKVVVHDSNQTPGLKSELTMRMQDLQIEKLRYIADIRLEDQKSTGVELKEKKIDGVTEEMLESVVAAQVDREIERGRHPAQMQKLAELEAITDQKNRELQIIDERKSANAEKERKLTGLARHDDAPKDLSKDAEKTKAENEEKEAERLKRESEIQRRVDEKLQAILKAKTEEYEHKYNELLTVKSVNEVLVRKEMEEASRSEEDKREEEFERARKAISEERAQRVVMNKATLEFANARSPSTATIFDACFPDDYLGLHIAPFVVTCNTLAGPLSTIDCCVVTQSELTPDMLPGDILLSVNERPLRSYRAEGLDGPHPEFYNSVIAAISNCPPPRIIRYLRIPLTENDNDHFIRSRDVGFADAILLLSDTQ
jgi:hypothetical protein